MAVVMKQITFIDAEVVPESGKISDFGAIRPNGEYIHGASLDVIRGFLLETDFLCGHNIISHDLKYLNKYLGQIKCAGVIDTLHLSALLFPQRPYHSLVKDDKLLTDEINNPVSDSKKAMELLFDEIGAFNLLPDEIKRIFYILLNDKEEFKDFFKYIKYNSEGANLEAEKEIRKFFYGKLCENADIKHIIDVHTIELAYCLSLIYADDEYSITPPWVLMTYPYVDSVMNQLRGIRCLPGCEYCNETMDAVKGLKRFFGYDAYRSFDGVPLQEQAVNSAINGESLLAVFPTGGGKSITFQIPALMAGRNTKSLSVVISPLQSLMKDQVDNLEKINITDAVTINGLLDPIERAEAIKRVESGDAHILYIAPESLRSKPIEKLLQDRKIARFIIDEAHCFSAWGQDFRVDYLYIAEFIKKICEKKNLDYIIPVSCFTATAKQNVIDDIRKYFKETLNLELKIYTADSGRKNLTYKVIQNEGSEKYETLRNLIEYNNCPTIIYVSRTKQAEDLAERLTEDGYEARPYHGQMEIKEKSENQDAFIRGEVDIMVATSAFGMGVDKKDVGMVVHYDISDSLENYIQEAGRAGRDQSINARCYVLFNDGDLDKHFIRLNRTKISLQEIQQIWKAIKNTTKLRSNMSNSALEIAKKAGWDEGMNDLETRVKTAVAALESAGYIKRGQNMPRVFADSIMVRTMKEASEKIAGSDLFNENEKQQAARIMSKLISARSRSRAGSEDAESRVDYISDHLGIEKAQVIHVIQLLRQAGILSDAKDLTVFMDESSFGNKSFDNLYEYIELERFLLSQISEKTTTINIKGLNELALEADIKSSNPDKIKTVFNFWSIKGLVKRSAKGNNHLKVLLLKNRDETLEVLEERWTIAEFILKYLQKINVNNENTLEFSVLELMEEYNFNMQLLNKKAVPKQIEDSLFYLSKIGILKIEGGFLVMYNAISIERLINDNKKRYKADDYKTLKDFYKHKMEMIHIVGEYAKKMMEDYNSALRFVDDYFRLEYSLFLKKYFKGQKGDELQRNMTPDRFRQLFGRLSPAQLGIINDKESKYILVAAGPGSGKTRILVHKLAAVLQLEDVKNEQLLMITFSRAAATEFKKRLMELIGTKANYVEIKTFHSYCFDLLGLVGNIEKSNDIINNAVDSILNNEVEQSRITKTVLVIDEAQDMDANEYRLVKTLMERNDDMRLIAVGDDDQNIFSFRGSDSKYMSYILNFPNSKMYELVENYRSSRSIVDFSNDFVQTMKRRLKSMPITAVSKEKGNVTITKYNSSSLIVPVTNNIIRNGIYGSTCILTKTNEEALQIYALLDKNGIKAGMVQRGGMYNLKNLIEVRYFVKELKLSNETPLINDEEWEYAKKRTFNRFAQSENLPLLKQILSDFEETAGEHVYKSDFLMFIEESCEEDFYSDTGKLTVSTIHKSKGKEFDHVVMVLRDLNLNKEETKRQLYVGMTRAKKSLSIHYNGDFIERKTGIMNMILSNIKYEYDSEEYPPAEIIAMQLKYTDVYLSHFYRTIRLVKRLNSGDILQFDENGCFDKDGNNVLLFSTKFKNEIQIYMEKGYKPLSAKVNHILFWKQEDSEKETLIVLPQLTFINNSSNSRDGSFRSQN
jgi:ATP-dependent DNA helicase RecQ